MCDAQDEDPGAEESGCERSERLALATGETQDPPPPLLPVCPMGSRGFQGPHQLALATSTRSCPARGSPARRPPAALDQAVVDRDSRRAAAKARRGKAKAKGKGKAKAKGTGKAKGAGKAKGKAGRKKSGRPPTSQQKGGGGGASAGGMLEEWGLPPVCGLAGMFAAAAAAGLVVGRSWSGR